jgi:type VI secretion system protein ImpA
MTLSQILDIEALIAPVAADNPAGEPLPYELRHKLEELRKEDDPNRYADDDPMRPSKFKAADWSGIVQLAQETLTSTSKDLLVAARLTEALVKLHGFAGLRDGLHLLRELLEQCWDRLHPTIEDGDLDVRAGPLRWLDDPVKGACFPSTLRLVPLVSSDQGKHSWQDWDDAQKKKGQGNPTPWDEFEKAVEAAQAEDCQRVADEITQSREALGQLLASVRVRLAPLGQDSPGLTGIGQALEVCHRLMQEIMQRKWPVLPEKSNNEAEASSPGAATPPRRLASREEAYRQLAEAAALLRQLEPHSPIPYLIQRAVELGKLPFPQLMRRLVRDANVLAELERELGVTASAHEPSEAE